MRTRRENDTGVKVEWREEIKVKDSFMNDTLVLQSYLQAVGIGLEPLLKIITSKFPIVTFSR